ncbi:MAG TPA: hypothetical protein VE891_09030 [Allosphingosinicella sp.]|nr:hypothetical protein [Allosphingosinicella sp.]
MTRHSGRPGRRTAVDWKEIEERSAAEMGELGMPPDEAKAEAAKKVGRARQRFEWARERLDSFFAMQDKAGEAYMRQIEEHPEIDWDDEDAPELPEPPEAALAQSIYEEVMDALNKDRWPRHLHFRDV